MFGRTHVITMILVIGAMVVMALPTGSSAKQDEPLVWQSQMVWRPSLEESANAVTEVVNQIDAVCNVDVDNVVATNGAGPEGAVYAFLVTWACPSESANAGVSTWQSAMVWNPNLADAGIAVAELVNQIEAPCSVDVDPVVSTNGGGPEGTLYAFLITWACRG